MYPIAECRRRCLRVIRRGVCTTLATLATVLLFVATALHLSEPWHHHELPYNLLLVWGTIAAAGLTLLFESLWRHARHPLTRCPHCRRPLTDYVPVVIASGCCFSCGKRVLELSVETPAEALIPRAEFLLADTGYQGKAVPLLIGGVLATYAGLCGAFAVVNRIRLPEPLPAVVFVALVAVAPVSAVVVLRWLAAAGKRNSALACPGCGKLLAGARMLTTCTGNCIACGCRAILPRVRPLAPPHLGPLWTIPQLTALEKHRTRTMRWMFALLGVVFVVTLGLLVLGQQVWDADRLRAMGLNWASAQLVERVGPVFVGLAGAVVALVVLRGSLRPASRRHPIDCPRCGREMLVPFARATKCCAQCGWRVVATPPDRPHDG